MSSFAVWLNTLENDEDGRITQKEPGFSITALKIEHYNGRNFCYSKLLRPGDLSVRAASVTLVTEM